MTKGTAEDYWAATAEGYFDAMSSPYQPGERVGSDPAPKPARRGLPPLTASQTIVDAIAACAQPREGVEQPVAAPAAQQGIVARKEAIVLQGTPVTAD